MNRLSREKSPYLLQHAANPVNWFPWGEAAFEQAHREDKPIFLSIGYSTCHWCHVMAHESFEDADVAALLNRDFVCIKVDREERPDIDAVYLAVCQLFTGSGGWPLTVIMTPDQKPFWAGTYLPKTASYGRMGLIELLDTVRQLWKSDRHSLLSRGDQAASLLNTPQKNQEQEEEPTKALLEQAAGQFKSIYDFRWGGFGVAPKFPTPHNLLLLLRYFLLEKDDFALQMVRHTLTQMFRGGIFDHLGGGFSRYSTDEKWLVPHFEKTLYDNALLALAYLEAYHITRDGFFQRVAERTLDYVLRELRDGSGGFYCGQDADSDGVEGKYYVFTKREVFDVLGKDDGAAFCDWFGITEHGNFAGTNILNLLNNPQYAEKDPWLEALSRKLYAYRLNRTRLHKDDKVLTAWNGLIIVAFARAGWLLGKPAYTQAAKKAEEFLQTALTDENGELKLRFRDGEAAHAGQLDDYAFYALALLELYKATYEIAYLQRALRISEQMIRHFWDSEQGGFFLYSREGEKLISRPKETYDGALPSGNSAAALALETLSKLTGKETWRQLSRRQISFLTGALREYPTGHSVALLAISAAVYPSLELICVTAEENVPEELTVCLTEKRLPNLNVLVKTRGNQEKLEQAVPFTGSYPIPQNGTRYYLCRDGACDAPVGDIKELRRQLTDAVDHFPRQ